MHDGSWIRSVHMVSIVGVSLTPSHLKSSTKSQNHNFHKKCNYRLLFTIIFFIIQTKAANTLKFVLCSRSYFNVAMFQGVLEVFEQASDEVMIPDNILLLHAKRKFFVACPSLY